MPYDPEIRLDFRWQFLSVRNLRFEGGTPIMEAPDPVDLVRLQERNEGLNLVIVEKEKRIEDLTREVTTLKGFAHYLKTVEVKQIEAPASEKKSFLDMIKFW